MWEEAVDRARTRHDARDFRTALGCFPTGVCLITALAPDGARVGLTANHIIVIGVVERYAYCDVKPLVFHRGAYAAL